MDTDTLEVTSHKPVPKPALMGTPAISRLNREGLRTTYEPLNIVDEAREVLARMPESKSGIVLGSGPNTESWKQKGWKTLDINPASKADYTTDANKLETVISPNSQDFLHAEFIRFDPKGVEGVGPGRLLQQANKALKDGGIIIVETAHQEGMPTTLPDRQDFIKKMADHGFQAVAELHEIKHPGNGASEQKVVYYGRKLAEGYQEGRPQF